MRRTSSGFLAVSLVVPFALLACGAPSPPEGGVSAATAGPADVGGLEALARTFQAAQGANDAERLRRLGASLLPTADDLRAVLRAAPETDAFVAAYTARSLPPEGVAALARAVLKASPGQTDVHAYRATTEELAAYERGSTAFQEFPGGMRRFAQTVAAPGRAWFVVECVEPGKTSGMKYTCFAHVEGRWIFVAKPWRHLPPEREPAEPDAPEREPRDGK